MTQSTLPQLIETLPKSRPVLIAGPTASGKSSLALSIARTKGGVIVNADALQVFENWRILTARPSAPEEEVAEHLLYGHVPGDQDYSVGQWLRDLSPILAGDKRPIIVGGTGLYFSALTDGLAQIPLTPPDIREEADRLRKTDWAAMLTDLDDVTLSRIDPHNPMRVQRAWEVQRTTGRGLAAWQDDTPPPLLPLSETLAIHVNPDRDVLRERIARRFDSMLELGALREAEANLATWSETAPSSKAIGAKELIAHLKGEMTLDDARESAIVASQQYAKRQRTWFRKRMRDWHEIQSPDAF